MNTRQKPLLIALTMALAGACASNPGTAEDDDENPSMADDDDGDDDATPAPSGGDAQTSSGGGSDAGSSGGGGGAECANDTPSDEKDLIATFEDMTVGVNPAGGWVGGFYIFNDKMNDPVAQMASVQAVDRCSESKYAYCTKGAGFTVWGAGIGTDLGALDMATMKKATVDLSAYSGISFWVKRNGGTMPASAKLIVPDANTSDEGGSCSNAADAAATMKCDPFTTNIPLSNTWTKQTIMFSKLKQGAWGKAVPSFSKDKVFGIQLQVGPSTPFDICFDQLVLVR
jgi:hypothetical protein